jgi:hypothetical protein
MLSSEGDLIMQIPSWHFGNIEACVALAGEYVRCNFGVALAMPLLSSVR